MASIVLGAVGKSVGALLPSPFNFLSPLVGKTLGGAIDGQLFGGKTKQHFGPRLEDLAVQTSTYGKMIPIVYGTMRLGGNIIWSRPIKETATTTTTSAGGGKGGGKVSASSTTYSYSVTIAIAVCEGPVDDVLRIWADAKQLDLSQYTVRIYKGDAAQLPDTIIQSFEGADKTPAYRGLAYVVLEDFPLADFGNRIPNFSFEVQKKTTYPDYNGDLLEEIIHGMTLIPGAGEYVYDTQIEYKVTGTQVGSNWVQQGEQQSINMHNAYGIANAMVSLNQLENVCPNVEWVSVVVTWFGDTMDAGTCVVKPGVEFQTGAITSPDTWQVGTFDRSTAKLITFVDDAPQYGGTPDDDSILRLLDELGARGYNIMFYPIMFMDVTGKPWRGDLTGSAANVSSFFTKTDGYNAFVTHYANLVNGKVDAFIIGSELKGLTKVSSTPGAYPAVNQLITLAGTVKSILGGSVKVTYAADWSEYHHDTGGWYNLDPLWASSNIDVVGIDAYFPLSDAPQHGYDIDALIDGWTSGEGYEWYYSDPDRTIQTPLTPQYAWKNIDWFWNNTHVNPNAVATAWTPQMKKIWFTEYGFPSVDGATNQPNVFYDPSSTASAFPYKSKGRVDFRAQRAALVATEEKWKTSTMIERMFIWTWDARPFPYWPDLLNIWNDGAAWKTGHWVQGKLGISSLAGILTELCARAGLSASDIDVEGLTDQVEGFVVASPQSIRNLIETLQQGYFFDSVESDYILKFVARGGDNIVTIPENDLVMEHPGKKNTVFGITRIQEIELSKRVNLVYLNRLYNYQSATQYSQRETTESQEKTVIELPIVFSDQVAKNIADVRLYSEWVGRTNYQFSLPMKYAQLEPTDIITVSVSGVTHRVRIVSVQMQSPRILRVQAVAEDNSAYDFYSQPGQSSQLLQQTLGIPTTRLELMDIPAFPGDDNDKAELRLAVIGNSGNWTGAAVYRSDDNGASYNQMLDITTAAIIGNASNALASGPTTVFDETNTLTVVLMGSGELSSATELAVLNGANAGVLGNEIFQFKTATLIEPGKYTLGGLLRGRLGTEWAVGSHAAGERFVFLDGNVQKQILANTMIGLNRIYKGVTFNSSLSSASAQNLTYSGAALKPYSPVQIAGTRDGSGNLTINWIRRTRLGGAWQDGVDAPLNEESETYEVDIMNGVDVVRTFIGLSTPTASYTAAQQTTDFGSPQANVSVHVYQMSAIVGRGYVGMATI
jgi:hypothetical protein